MYRLPISSRIRMPSSTAIHGLLNGAGRMDLPSKQASKQASKAFWGITACLVESLAQGFSNCPNLPFLSKL
jgi:hypothetical protein